MEVEPPAISPSRASSASTDESEFSVFKDSLRKKLDLWVGDVPSQDDSSFQCLIQRPAGTTGSRYHTSRPFKPKDQHCGIWKDAPNKECHASFGDQGTTASVSCYGDLIQMSQFLGVGHSGLFSIDHKLTDKPYYIASRADALNNLAKEGSKGGGLSFGLNLPKRFLPDKIPEIKWVNWKWPRYEWKVQEDGLSAQLSSQWLVKNNILLQQVTVTNTASSSIEDFSVRASQHMLIRDLDYLQGFSRDFMFNEDDSASYIRGRGPNDFSWITANIIHKETPAMNEENDRTGEQAGHTTDSDHLKSGKELPEINEEVLENKRAMSSSKPTSDEPITPCKTSSQENLQPGPQAEDSQSARAKNVSTKQHQRGTDEHTTSEKLQGHNPNATSPPPSDDELWQKRRMSNTWSAKDTYAIVSVMSLFVNGTTEKMGMEPVPISMVIGAAGSSSSVLEIVIAYRMIAIPKGQAYWKDFLISAAAVDVDTMLAAETEQLWGHSATDDCKCSQSLCDFGLAMVDPNESMNLVQHGSGPGTKAQNSEDASRDAYKSMTAPDDTRTSADTQADNTEEIRKRHERLKEKRAAKKINVIPGTDAADGVSEKPLPSKHIEYLTWRHAEHILSACAIPLSVPNLSTEDEQYQATSSSPESVTSNLGTSNREEIELEVPLVLTCGDMSGHRVCTSASFFAFQFLMDVLWRLSSVEQTPYVVSLQRRIDAACRGHIRWLEWLRKPWLTINNTESLLRSGCFAANYWVDGRIMPGGGSSWQPDDAVTDTPYQALKVTSYIKWLKTRRKFQTLENHRVRHHKALLRDIWTCWIHELDDLDKRKACAWRHKSEDGLNTYRLDDHVWLWNSLSELHDLGLWKLTDAGSNPWKHCQGRWISNIFSLSSTAKLDGETPKVATKEARSPEDLAELSSIARRLLPKEVQRAILQRFTVENDVSQERMLAVTRSARDTRFFFHTRDTALFYGHKRGFFRPDTSFSELWERTIKSQSHHEEALEEEWASPLRVALGAVAGLSNFSLDKRNHAELARRSVEDLIQCSAHSAFIPGQIDIATRKPSIYSDEEDRDYYYHVGFEVCHMLLAYARDIDLTFRSVQADPHSPAAKQNEGNSRLSQHEMFEIFLNEIQAQPKKQRGANYQHGSESKVLSKLFGADGRLDRKRNSMVMKRSMPFNSMIDASSITNLDEEWLYNFPEFLTTKSFDMRHQLKLLFDEHLARYRPINESVSSIIDKALESVEKPPPEKFLFTHYEPDHWLEKYTYDGLVASLPKQKSRRQKRGARNIGAALDSLPFLNFNEGLWDVIGNSRSAIKAKKRFLWLPARSDPQTALLCWLASTEAEKPAMSLFFDRHAEYDNHLWDDTTMVLNTWQTELHMCFWLIRDKRKKLHQGLPQPVVAPWPKDPYKELQRASIGFRFDGDFFDRYWTCHFVQYIPGLNIDQFDRFGTPLGWGFRFQDEKQSWQRKVLELQLLQYILNLILIRSNEILRDIQDDLGLGKGRLIFSVLTKEAYSSSADHWQTYEELLEKAEEDITSSLNTLSKWATREADRGQERPRWTRNDERKYRGYINKLHNQTERQRWDLESCRDKMCKLRETLSTRQDKIRAALEANREQNIRYFTYVTVIFLPLGFASSFYSMNGAPSNDLIISLAKFAAAAFAVTAILVLSVSGFIAAGAWVLSVAKDAISTANRAVLQPLQQHLHDARQHSLLVKGTSKHDELDQTETLHHAYSEKDWKASRWFWPAYLLLELPTRTISSAWTDIVAEGFSFGAVWKVALSFVVLPIYAMSRAVLSLFGNAALLLRISSRLHRLLNKRLSKDDQISRKKESESSISKKDVQQPQPSSKEVSERRGDPEKSPAGNRTFPDHFQELMPTTEPFQSLRLLERYLIQRMDNAETKEYQNTATTPGM